MHIKTTTVSINYKRVRELKRTYYNHENVLRRHFNEATVLPIPDDAPDEIPRITVTTLHDHGQLVITPVNAAFRVSYDENYENDLKQCICYVKERMESVFEFLDKLTKGQYEYFGIVTEVLIDMDGGAKTLAMKLLDEKRMADIVHDLDVRYTFVEDDDIFVNIDMRNVRLFKDGCTGTVAGSFSERNQSKNTICAVIDVNNRYGFNENPDFCSSKKDVDKLFEHIGKIIPNKLERLLDGGVYQYGCME